jgi:hypothetical protein
MNRTNRKDHGVGSTHTSTSLSSFCSFLATDPKRRSAQGSCPLVHVLGRHEDFTQGSLDECYVVHNSKAVVVKSEVFEAPDKESIKQIIQGVIEKLRT